MIIALGTHVKDVVTGFEGIVTGRTQYLTGCTRIQVQPKVSKGSWKEAQWFDEPLLEVIQAEAVVVPPAGVGVG